MDEPPALDPRAQTGEGAPPARERDGRLAELRAAVERGLDDIRAGRVVDLDSAFDRIEAMLDEIEAADRP